MEVQFQQVLAGTYDAKLDSKGRLFIPSKLRKMMEDRDRYSLEHVFEKETGHLLYRDSEGKIHNIGILKDSKNIALPDYALPGYGWLNTEESDGKSLSYFSALEWSIRSVEYGKKGDNDPERRKFFASGSHVQIDKQNRILIPHEYRREAGLEQSVKVIGNLDHIEIKKIR